MASLRRAVALVLFLVASSAFAQTPQQRLWEELERGNQQWVDGPNLEYRDVKKLREEVAGGQHPPVTVVSCSDSRVPPEIVFHRNPGQLFIVRAAGNVVDDMQLASIEYALLPHGDHGPWTKLIVVLGHSSCGAVIEALKPDDGPTPSLMALLARIRESFVGLPEASTPEDRLKLAVQANARYVAAWLPAHSRMVREAVEKGRIEIIPAYYDLESGKVTRVR